MNIINKAAGIIIVDRKLLVGRSKGKNFFISPGGKIEPGETDIQALIRELYEEFQIHTQGEFLKDFGTWEAEATGMRDMRVKMHVFQVQNWQGEIIPSSEVEEMQFITSEIPKNMELGSIFAHDVIPKLKALDLID